MQFKRERDVADHPTVWLYDFFKSRATGLKPAPVEACEAIRAMIRRISTLQEQETWWI